MIARRTAAVAALLALAVSGCAKVGPDYSPPQLGVADNWMEVGRTAAVAPTTLDRAWWTVFNDPVLDRLVDTAYRQNLSLQAAGIRVLQARAQLAVAVGNFYPQTQQGFGSLTYHRQSANAPFQAGPSSQLGYWQNQIGLQAAWELDFWGKFRRAIESADANLLASLASYDNALVTLTADVANSYVLIRTLEARVTIALENVEVQRESLRIAQARFSGGTTSERDVQQALTVLSSTEATVPQLETTLGQTKNALSTLLGMPPGPLDGVLAGDSAIPDAPMQVAAGIPADLLRRRPDIRAAELQAISQSAQIGIAKADLYPAISLTGNFGLLSSSWNQYDLSDIFMPKSRAYSFGPSFQWNILNYGQITNNVRSQDAAFQALVADYQNTVLQAQQEVEDGLIAFLKAQQRTALLERSAAAAQRSQELAVLQYREGITDFTTVLTAEQNLLTQQDSLATSRGDIPLGLVRTYRALGGGWEIREGQDVVPAEVREAMGRRTDWGNLLTPGSIERASQQAPGMPPAVDW